MTKFYGVNVKKMKMTMAMTTRLNKKKKEEDGRCKKCTKTNDHDENGSDWYDKPTTRTTRTAMELTYP